MILTFEAMHEADPLAPDPESTWSRIAWLPIVGPSCWVIWGTIARQLVGNKARLPDGRCMVAWPVEALARAHGLKVSDSAYSPLRKTLSRLSRFDLFRCLSSDEGGDRWAVRLSAPPLTEGQLDRSPSYVAAMQRQVFDASEVTA